MQLFKNLLFLSAFFLSNKCFAKEVETEQIELNFEPTKSLTFKDENLNKEKGSLKKVELSKKPPFEIKKEEKIKAEKIVVSEPTKFSTDNVKVDVPEGEPKKIEVPEGKKEQVDKTSDLFSEFGIERDKTSEKAFLGLLGSLRGELKPLPFSKIPFIDAIPLPKSVKKFFSNIVMREPSVKIGAKGGFSVTGQVDIYNVSVWSRVVVAKNDLGKTVYSIVVRLPKSWKFSDTFPKTKRFNPEKFDLLEFDEVWFALASSRYYDPILEREVREGLNIFGSVRPTGPLFKKIDKVFRGQLSEMDFLSFQGAIGLNEQLIGTMLLIDLPTKVKFSKWLETSPLKMIFAIEEKITQMATPVIAFRGALNVIFPLQKDPVELSLTGKYIFPEDIEFFAEMKGWIKNVPVLGMHWGDMRFGIVIDLIALAASEGMFPIAGLNVAGSVGIMDSYYSAAVKGAVSSDTGIGDLTYILKGTARLEDLVGFWFKNAEGIARLFKDVRFYDKVVSKIPNLEIEEVVFAFVPRETIEEKKRIEVQVGKVNIFGLKASGRLFFSRDSVSGFLSVPEIVIGPKSKPLFVLSGAGIEGEKGLLVEVNLSPFEQSMFADGTVKTALFGGLERSGRVDISPTGVEVRSSLKIANLVDADLALKAAASLSRPLSPENFHAKIRFEQELLDEFSKALKEIARKLLGTVQEKIDKVIEETLVKLKRKVAEQERASLKKMEKELQDIYYKRKACKEKYPKKYQGLLRGACEILKGVFSDQLQFSILEWHKEVTLKLAWEGGKLAIKSAGLLAKGATIPAGEFADFLSKILKNTLNVRAFEAEADSAKLLQGKPFSVQKFDAQILGKRVKIKDLDFDPQNVEDFFVELFEKLGGKK